MARRTRFGALALAAALVVGACSSGDDQAAGPDGTMAATGQDADSGQTTTGDGTSPETTAAPVERTAPEDTIVLATSVPLGSLDPHLSSSPFDLTYLSMVYDRLTELTNRLEVVPMLATEWSSGEGGTTLDMTLREGVVFEDGSPFDAAAVVANIERARSLPDGVAGRSLADVERVEELDPTHVRFHLSSAATDLPAILAGPAGFMVSPQALAAGTDLEVPGAAAGSGPFRLGAVEPGQSASYTPIEDYWDPERQRSAETQVVFVLTDAQRLAGFQSGAYDVVTVKGDLADDAIALGREQGFRYLTQEQNSVYGLMLNPTLPVLSSLEIRQAILSAVNRNDIVDDLMGGTCDSRVQAYPLGSTYYLPEIERQYGYDPELARQLVADSGIEDPSFDVYAAHGIYALLANRISTHLAEVGITMNVIETDAPDAATAWAEGEGSHYLLMTPATNPHNLLFGSYLRQQWWEDAITGAAGDQITQLGQLAADDPARTDVYRDLYTAINDLALFIPGCSITAVWMWTPEVQGVDLMPYLWAGQVLPYTIDRIG